MDEGEGLEECHKVLKRMREGEKGSKVMRWMREKDWRSVKSNEENEGRKRRE